MRKTVGNSAVLKMISAELLKSTWILRCLLFPVAVAFHLFHIILVPLMERTEKELDYKVARAFSLTCSLSAAIMCVAAVMSCG